MASIYLQSGIDSRVSGYGDLAYFGLNSNDDPWKRLDDHYRDLREGKHSNQYIQKFYNERGIGQIYRGIVIECDEYYLNTFEKAYIFHGNSNVKKNPEGWNKSAGGEGAKRNYIPYSFISGSDIFQGNDVLQFLRVTGRAEPGGFLQLLDGRLREYDGFRIY